MKLFVGGEARKRLAIRSAPLRLHLYFETSGCMHRPGRSRSCILPHCRCANPDGARSHCHHHKTWLFHFWLSPETTVCHSAEIRLGGGGGGSSTDPPGHHGIPPEAMDKFR